MRRYELTNEEWGRIKGLLPPERIGRKGRPSMDNRKMLNGMLWIAGSGAQWRGFLLLTGNGRAYTPIFANGVTTAFLKQYFVR